MQMRKKEDGKTVELIISDVEFIALQQLVNEKITQLHEMKIRYQSAISFLAAIEDKD